MSDFIRIENIYTTPEKYINQNGSIAGWSKTVRLAQDDTLLFIEINDGST